VRASDPVSEPEARRILNTYTGYSIGCAVVWALILAAGQFRLDSQNRASLRLTCAAWWTGWTSATIARAGYPPPQKLSPRGEKTLANVSLVLVALGLASAIRLLVTGGRPASDEQPPAAP
jgi:hypothetical protein